MYFIFLTQKLSKGSIKREYKFLSAFKKSLCNYNGRFNKD